MKNIYEGMWDYDGACDPLKCRTITGQQTFTLGCFQWVRRGKNGSGTGLKRGRVQYRVKGNVSDPHEAHARAKKFCETKNAQRTAREGTE